MSSTYKHLRGKTYITKAYLAPLAALNSVTVMIMTSKLAVDACRVTGDVFRTTTPSLSCVVSAVVVVADESSLFSIFFFG